MLYEVGVSVLLCVASVPVCFAPLGPGLVELRPVITKHPLQERGLSPYMHTTLKAYANAGRHRTRSTTENSLPVNKGRYDHHNNAEKQCLGIICLSRLFPWQANTRNRKRK